MSSSDGYEPEDVRPDEGLGRALDRLAVPPARAEFKARLLAQFVAAGSLDGSAAGALDPSASRAIDDYAPPPARPEFKAQLLRRFTAGESLPHAPRAARAARGERTRPWLLIGGLAAAAAAALVLFTQGRGPQSWTIVPNGFDPAQVYVDGRDLVGLTPARIDARLGAAESVVTGATVIRLRHADHVVIELAENSSLDLSRVIAEGELAGFDLAANSGSIRFSTGPDFPGMGLSVDTPRFDAEVTGTTFGVDFIDANVCLCVTEGTVELRPASAQKRLAIDRNESGVADGDGNAVEQELCSEHARPLHELDGFWD